MSSDTKIEISPSLLRTLHRIHRQRTDLQGRIARGPRQIQAGQKLVENASAELDQIRERLKKVQMACDEKQLQLKSRETKIRELEGKLNTAASNREFATLKEQIAADEQANSVLSDEILEGLEQIDQINEEAAAAEAELAKQQSEQQQRIKDVGETEVQLRSELERVDRELAETEKAIPSAAMTDYRRLIDAKGEDALAPIDNDSCGGCYQTLTTNLIDRLRMSMLIRCPNCNAYLYLPEDRRVR